MRNGRVIVLTRKCPQTTTTTDRHYDYNTPRQRQNWTWWNILQSGKLPKMDTMFNGEIQVIASACGEMVGIDKDECDVSYRHSNSKNWKMSSTVFLHNYQSIRLTWTRTRFVVYLLVKLQRLKWKTTACLSWSREKRLLTVKGLGGGGNFTPPRFFLNGSKTV